MIKKIVITGLGCITPIGNNADTFWENCLEGVKGFGPITQFDASRVKTTLAAEVKDFDAVKMLGRKQGRRLDRYSQFAVHAAREAVECAGLDFADQSRPGYVNPYRVGVCLGTGVGGIQTYEEEMLHMESQGSTYVNPLLMPKWIPNMAAANVSMDLKLRGPVHTISTACASGIDAIGHGMLLLESGRVDLVLVGGAEACITPTMIAGFENMGALSSETNPEKASIPFDEGRDGFVLGEGAAVLVIETLESAESRSAEIIAEIAGYGSTTDAHHLTAPHPEAEGGIRAVKMALEDAGIVETDIDYISAHGTSTPQNDSVESKCIRAVFGEYTDRIAVNSTKSMVGHMQGAAGALETIVCALSLKNSKLHPTAGTSNLDPACDIQVVQGEEVDKSIEYALNNALGFGGHNASLVLKAWNN